MIGNSSTDFLGVPEKVLERMAGVILPAYQELELGIRKIEFESLSGLNPIGIIF